MRAELAALRSFADHAPLLAWREDQNRRITWTNSGYNQIVDQTDNLNRDSWPPPHLFDETDTANPTRHSTRNKVELQGDQSHGWFEN
jgi:PAS domain-containing protein